MKDSKFSEVEIKAIEEAYWSLQDGLDAARLTYEENHVIITDIKESLLNLGTTFPWLDKEYNGN